MPNASLSPSPIPSPAGAPGANIPQFGAPAGNNPAVTGYNAALQNLGQSLNLAGNTTSGQIAGLGQQLQQNQGNIRQQLTNTGLANSTILPTEEQAPLQTYNLGVANAQNNGALLQMNAYNNLANLSANAGNALNQPGTGLPKNVNPSVNTNLTPGSLTGPGGAQQQPFGGGAGGGGAAPASPAQSQYQQSILNMQNQAALLSQGGTSADMTSSINGTSIAGYDSQGNPVDSQGNVIPGAIAATPTYAVNDGTPQAEQ